MTLVRKPVCILTMGRTLPEIVPRRGDFEDWICKGLGIGMEEAKVVDVFEGAPLPAVSELAAVVVTGSSAYVSEREAWSERSAEWIASVAAAEKPLLGICYGHQLLAHALGGRVDRNPKGREIGTVEVILDAKSGNARLLHGLPDRLIVQVSHLESVLELPGGSKCHGASAADPNQIFSLGERIWGVQFHPEFDAEIVRLYIEGRRQRLVDESLDPDALLEATRDSPHGERILARFMEIVRDHAR